MNQADKNQAQWSQAKARYIESKGKGEANFTDSDWEEVNKLYNQMAGGVGVGMAKSQIALDLIKGAMSRLAPFNPKDVLSDENKNTIANWQGTHSDDRATHREALPTMDGPARERALHKLAGSTNVRRANDNKREFLLHRGMSQDEAAQSISGSKINHPTSHSSWTPKENTANNFANPYIKAPGQRVSAWVHEDNIHMIPKQYGSVDAEYEASSGSKQNRMHIEHEVVVKPNHNSSIHESKPAEKPTTYTKDRIHDAPRDLNDKINMAGVKDAKDRKLFGKSDLSKGSNGDWKAEGYTFHHHEEGSSHHVTAKDKQGKDVGEFQFAGDVTGDRYAGKLMPMVSEVDKSHQRKGIANEAYRLAEEKSGKKIERSPSQSKEARSLWNDPNRNFGKSFNQQSGLSKTQSMGHRIGISNNNVGGLFKGKNGDHKAEGYTFSHEPTNDPKDKGSFEIFASDKHGNHAGNVYVSHKDDKNITVGVQVDDKHQRKGLANEMFRQAEKTTGKKASYSAHTDEAKALWAQPDREFGKSDILPKDTAKPGVSPQGIEVRRADKKADKDLPHGYQRTNTPEAHMEAAKGMARAAIARLKETKPKLTKAELIEAEDLLYKGAMARLAKSDDETVKLYHITDKAKFKLNPDHAPEDNAVAIQDRSGLKGLYTTPSVESWVNGHGYARPFVAEIHVPKSLLSDKSIGGRYGGEKFIPAEHFDKIKVHRVMPIDAHAREQYGSHGWFEGAAGTEFDTGNKITAKAWETPHKDYKYTGKDVRDMSPDETKALKQHFKVGYKARMGKSELSKAEIALDLFKGAMQKPDLSKGQNGDWKSEGYHIHHEWKDNQNEDLAGNEEHDELHVYARSPKGETVGHTVMVPHESHPDKLMPGMTNVFQDHQRKGLASAMYQHAGKVSGKEVVGSTLQSGSAMGLWDSIEKSDKTKLAKGAMSRLAPFNPKDDVPSDDRTSTEDWINGYGEMDRDAVPQMPDAMKMRSLHRLSGMTATRMNTSGEREFLLHRGMGMKEANASIGKDGSGVNHTKLSSWSTSPNIASDFAKDHHTGNLDSVNPIEIKHQGAAVSAWINEKHIHSVPFMMGSMTEGEGLYGSGLTRDNPTKSHQRSEKEVIVAANHRSELHQASPVGTEKVSNSKRTKLSVPGYDEPKSPTGVHSRINTRATTKAFDAKPLTKSEIALDLIKGAMQRIAPFNPGNVSMEERKPTETWAAGFMKNRDDLPAMSGNLRERGLHRLSGQTATRTNDKGDREFLLHRGMSDHEHNKHVKNGVAMHQKMSSWTPYKKAAAAFAGDYSDEDDQGKLVSAWVNEKHIHSIPHMIGSKLDYEGNDRGNPTPQKMGTRDEFEVVVKPKHGSTVANTVQAERKDNESDDYHVPSVHAKPTDVHGKINDKAWRVSKEYNPYNMAKSDLEKGAKGDWKAEGYKIKHIESIGGYHRFGAFKGKDMVAELAVAHDKKKDKTAFVEGAHVEKEHRRKGIGTALYSLAEKHLKTSISNEDYKSKDAKKFWAQPKRSFGDDMAKSEIKTCSCGHKLTTENSEYIGMQELPEGMKPGMKMALYNCPKCASTVTHLTPK